MLTTCFYAKTVSDGENMREMRVIEMESRTQVSKTEKQFRRKCLHLNFMRFPLRLLARLWFSSLYLNFRNSVLFSLQNKILNIHFFEHFIIALLWYWLQFDFIYFQSQCFFFTFLFVFFVTWLGSVYEKKTVHTQIMLIQLRGIQFWFKH